MGAVLTSSPPMQMQNTYYDDQWNLTAKDQKFGIRAHQKSLANIHGAPAPAECCHLWSCLGGAQGIHFYQSSSHAAHVGLPRVLTCSARGALQEQAKVHSCIAPPGMTSCLCACADHLSSWKVDLDIMGQANSFHKTVRPAVPHRLACTAAGRAHVWQAMALKHPCSAAHVVLWCSDDPRPT